MFLSQASDGLAFAMGRGNFSFFHMGLIGERIQEWKLEEKGCRRYKLKGHKWMI